MCKYVYDSFRCWQQYKVNSKFGCKITSVIRLNSKIFLDFSKRSTFPLVCSRSVGVAVVVAKRQIAFISTLDASDSKTIPKPQRSQCLP